MKTKASGVMNKIIEEIEKYELIVWTLSEEGKSKEYILKFFNDRGFNFSMSDIEEIIRAVDVKLESGQKLRDVKTQES